VRVIVCGGGIAGLTLACRLGQFGWDALIVEQAPRLRDEGYMLDFFGPGFEAAQAMVARRAPAEPHAGR
jgi:2-polyprenyl-6-methoxyphenol hydroxylase-like FAD-dependent oxidoreductase